MASTKAVVLVFFHSVWLVTCLIGNLFILTVHFLNWQKTRKLSSSELIINCITICNIGLQGFVAFKEISLALLLKFSMQFWMFKFVAAFLTSLSFSSLWSTAGLCFYYCIQIVQFNGSVLYKVKANISNMVPWLLVVINVISWITGLSVYWDIYKEGPPSLVNVTLNGSSVAFNLKSRCTCLFQSYILLSTLAFSIIFVTCGTIIFSLHKHMIQITNKIEGFGNSRLTSLRSAARTVTSLLILYLVLFGTMNTLFQGVAVEGSALQSLIVFAIAATCPTINAIILITGNRKLSNAVKHFLGIKSVTTNIVVSVTTL